MRRFAVVLASTLLCACFKVQDTMPTSAHLLAESEAERAPVLLVLLPGAGDRVGTFDKHGIIEATRAAGLEVDLLEVDAHVGYYYGDRALLERMGEDVIAPNRDRYDQIWVVGISLGGLGALLTALTYPDDVDGLVLLSPYLGKRAALREISEAGGIPAWEPPAKTDAEASTETWTLDIWRMLDEVSQGERELELYLYYGDHDVGVPALDMLAAGLPSDHSAKVPGRHSWSTWSRAWDVFLATSPNPARR